MLMAWMEPEYYQGMDVDAVNVCKGEHYQKILWVKEADILKDCAIQYWIYWVAFQVEAVKVLILFEEAMQVQRDPNKQWFSIPYKLFDAELKTIVNDWCAAWREPFNLEEVSTSPRVDAPVDLVPEPNQQSHRDLDEDLS